MIAIVHRTEASLRLSLDFTHRPLAQARAVQSRSASVGKPLDRHTVLPHTQIMSRKGKNVLFAAGLLIYVTGLALLILVNSRASNWAGAVSPLLILGGLATIFVSLLLRPDDAPGNEADGREPAHNENRHTGSAPSES